MVAAIDTRLAERPPSERTPSDPAAAFDVRDSGAPISDSPPAADDDRAFLDDLFAKRDVYLVRERFANIGEANDFFTKVVGVSFEGRQDSVGGLGSGDELQLVREAENAYDSNAVAVRYGTLQIGFLRREIAKRLAPNIDAGDRYTARVASITGGGARSTGVNIHVRRERLHRPATAATGTTREAASAEAVRVALIGERPLRAAQETVLERLASRRNTLAVLGTGRGKSLCFQLPAAEAALARCEKTLVFYPLRALANDQFEALRRRLDGFGLRIFRANGSIDGDERAALEAALESGEWDLILATPEFATFHRSAFLRTLNRPHFIVVDEAHHIFESRHRPAYGQLGALVRELGAPLVLALTATANEDAFRAIRRELAIDAWVIDPTVRENLHVIDARNTTDKQAYLGRELGEDRKAIVYCNSRAEVAKVAERPARALRALCRFLSRRRTDGGARPHRRVIPPRRRAARRRNVGLRRRDRSSRRARRRALSPQFRFYGIQPDGRACRTRRRECAHSFALRRSRPAHQRLHHRSQRPVSRSAARTLSRDARARSTR